MLNPEYEKSRGCGCYGSEDCPDCTCEPGSCECRVGDDDDDDTFIVSSSDCSSTDDDWGDDSDRELLRKLTPKAHVLWIRAVTESQSIELRTIEETKRKIDTQVIDAGFQQARDHFSSVFQASKLPEDDESLVSVLTARFVEDSIELRAKTANSLVEAASVLVHVYDRTAPKVTTPKVTAPKVTAPPPEDIGNRSGLRRSVRLSQAPTKV